MAVEIGTNWAAARSFKLQNKSERVLTTYLLAYKHTFIHVLGGVLPAVDWATPQSSFIQISHRARLLPAGISFDTDKTKMSNMQVYVQGASNGGEIVIRDLIVTGYLNLEEGMVTGGGRFIAEDRGNFIGTIPNGIATLGFIARQKDGKSCGEIAPAPPPITIFWTVIFFRIML